MSHRRRLRVGPVLVLLVLATRATGGESAPPAAAAAPPSSVPPSSVPPSSGPAASVPAALAVYPPAVDLRTARDRQSVVVQASYDGGLTRDVTQAAKLTLEQPAAARLEGNVLHPLSDGSATLRVEFEGKTAAVPVEVKEAARERPISFKLDVMPVFTRAGCNSGSCHGAARGKDGFRLSLFGYDPDGDHHRLTRELSTRRLDLALPAESLLLAKPTGKAPHTGGTRFSQGNELYATLMRWLEAGAPADGDGLPRLLGIDLFPPSAVLEGAGEVQRLVVRARYSDGSDRDVTSLAHFLSTNDTSARVSPEGLITAGDRGEAFILARFATYTVGTPVVVLPRREAGAAPFAFPDLPEENWIDRLVHRKLRALRMAPSAPAGDEAFLRRAHLDLVGVLPTVEEHHSFVESADPKKRERLVDDLLGRKEFIELWVMKWAELLQIRSSQQVSYKAMLLYFKWLEAKLQENTPLDRLVQELLSATGGTFGNPATNYYQAETDTLKVAENVAQVFLGMRIQCAQCHNHPFDRWTQDDYYGFAAFFSQIGRKGGEDPRETIVFNRGDGEVAHPVGGRAMKPKFLGGAEPELAGKDRRQVLAAWLASPENPYFASNLANIVWAHFFGRGIIHEVDDVRVSNPPVNGELLEELGKRFTTYRYDLKKLVRDICTSRTYGLSTEPSPSNAHDERNFSRALPRRLRAEVLLDCTSQVTGTRDKFPGLPLGARAVQMADGSASTYFLSAFGRATRATVCSCEVKVEPNLSQALHLLNGDTLARKIAQGGLVERRLKEGRSPAQVIDELYLRCLSRRPTAEELARLEEEVKADPELKRVIEDVFWALLNSREFIFNH